MLKNRIEEEEMLWFVDLMITQGDVRNSLDCRNAASCCHEIIDNVDCIAM